MLLKDIIMSIPLLDFFTEREKDLFCGIDHSILDFKKGDVILKEGDEPVPLYLLLKGSAIITQTSGEKQIQLTKLKPGEIFGEMSFFKRKPRASNVMSKDDTTVLKMDDEFFNKIDPRVKDKIKNYFLELLIQRLDVMNDQIMTISRLMHRHQ